MAFTLENVVPWGRDFEEYTAMFALGDEDMGKAILGCGDGPASFNAMLTRRGGCVVSVDPVYRFSAEEIAGRVEEAFETVMAQTRRNADEFVWSHISSPEALGRMRLAAMHGFLADYPRGRSEGRYVPAELPALPFADRTFDLALCSHFLFLYSAHFDLEFHLRSLRELCRVAAEVRVFPLLELGSVPSRHLAAVLSGLASQGCRADIERVGYEFQKGGNAMLRIRPPAG